MTDWEGSAVTGTLAALERRRDAIKAAAEAMLLEARADGMETLDDARDAKFRAMQTDHADLEYRIDTQRAEARPHGPHPHQPGPRCPDTDKEEHRVHSL